ISYSRKRVSDLMRIAARDLDVARHVMDESMDWSYSIAYNSMLQSSRALMFARGFRPSGERSHLAVVMFLRASFSKQLGPVNRRTRPNKKETSHLSI
ncbi:MAG TPA: hypothetical protein VFE98_02510, partial [Candidatus Bathyarchaeia archaeon]|nr:hypothetical protein [Candidatus Bathyarchaeia archaeon]